MTQQTQQEARTEKLTALVTPTTMERIRALRLATMESTGDLINRLVAREIAEHPSEIAEGLKLLAAEAERRERTARRRRIAEAEAPKNPRPPEDGQTAPAGSRIVELARALPDWASQANGEERSRRNRYVGRFLEWCRTEDRTGTMEDLGDWAQVLALDFSHQTMKNMRSAVKRFLEHFDAGTA